MSIYSLPKEREQSINHLMTSFHPETHTYYSPTNNPVEIYTKKMIVTRHLWLEINMSNAAA